MKDTTSSAVVVTIHPRRVALVLAMVVGTLVVVSVILNVIKVVVAPGPIDWLVDLFRLNREQDIPSFVSGALFLAAALLFGLVWQASAAAGRRRLPWLALSLLFLFFAYDELFAVHELLIDPMRRRFDLAGLLHFAWIPVYLPVVAAVAWMFWPAWRDLERPIRMWFAGAALIFVTGTMFFEMLGGARYSGAEGDVVYGLLYTAEESLEMAGLVMVVYALLLVLEGSSLRVNEPVASPDQGLVVVLDSTSTVHSVSGSQ